MCTLVHVVLFAVFLDQGFACNLAAGPSTVYSYSLMSLLLFAGHR